MTIVTRRWIQVALCVASASAIASPASGDEPESRTQSVVVVHPRCEQFWKIAPKTSDVTGWNQVISFATCTRDTFVARIDDVEMLPELVDGMLEALLVPTSYYLAAAQRGPEPVKLRAVYHIGMAYLSLVVRARQSIVPPDIATSPTAARDHAVLLGRLEPLLAPSARVALMSFALIDRVATAAPQLGADPVNTEMIRSARVLAPVLERALREDPESLLALPSPP